MCSGEHGFDIDWEDVMKQARSLKHKQRRKLIKKVKRSYKRRTVAASIHVDCSDDSSDDDTDTNNIFIGCLLPDNYINPYDRTLNKTDSAKIEGLNGGNNADQNAVKVLPVVNRDDKSSCDATSTNNAVSSHLTTSGNHANGDDEETPVHTGMDDVAKDAEISKLLDDIDQEIKEWHNPFLPSDDTYSEPKNSTRMTVDHQHGGSATFITNASDNHSKPICTFYEKVGSCRFGDRCSRYHKKVETSDTLLLRNMFSTFAFEIMQRARRNYHGDADDLSLEHSDDDLFAEFIEFSADVLPELETYGRVVQFKVCCNRDSHLLGNVYVQYSTEEQALRASEQLNGRFYGGKCLTCQFVAIKSWKAAICGIHYMNRICSRGNHCNFLHVFKDPSGRFHKADVGSLRPESKYVHSRERSSRSSHDDRKSNRRHSHSKSKERSHRRKSISPLSDNNNELRQKSSNKSSRKHKKKHRTSDEKHKHKKRKHKHKKKENVRSE